MIPRKGSEPQNKPVIGLSQSFQPGEYDRVEKILADLKQLRLTDLRFSIPLGNNLQEKREWHEWLFRIVSPEVRLLPSLHFDSREFFPAELKMNHRLRCDALIRHLKPFATSYGDYFEWVELCPPPASMNGSWKTSHRTILNAVSFLHDCGKKVVLGGMPPLESGPEHSLVEPNIVDGIDGIGIHDLLNGPEASQEMLSDLRKALEEVRKMPEIWITETGYSTWQYDEFNQLMSFLKITETPVQRIYWHSGYDTQPDLNGRANSDRRPGCYGLKLSDGMPKLLYRIWSNEGMEASHGGCFGAGASVG